VHLNVCTSISRRRLSRNWDKERDGIAAGHETKRRLLQGSIKCFPEAMVLTSLVEAKQ
jgi:hypothetical protein